MNCTEPSYAPTVEAFFNTPESPVDLSRLLREIREARYCLGIAMAWLTDENVVDAAIDSAAATKFFVFNRTDIERTRDPQVRRSYVRLMEHIHDVEHRHLRMRISAPEWRPPTWPDLDDLYFPHQALVAGSSRWQDGIMHHKFVLIDHAVIWTGSMNLTIQARRNFEALLRIEDEATSIAFWGALGAMLNHTTAWAGENIVNLDTGRMLTEAEYR